MLWKTDVYGAHHVDGKFSGSSGGILLPNPTTPNHTHDQRTTVCLSTNVYVCEVKKRIAMGGNYVFNFGTRRKYSGPQPLPSIRN
mmetsp:Transcript_41387/g.42015  ORF Transcript_41387/g.42015 Transcript_41387/m.42015 type:complete len:85 (-) Transcript_41387:80-334(-)